MKVSALTGAAALTPHYFCVATVADVIFAATLSLGNTLQTQRNGEAFQKARLFTTVRLSTILFVHFAINVPLNWIEAIEERLLQGVKKTYLRLKVAQGDLTVLVPAENADVVGVRDVVGQEGLDKVFEVLRAPHTEEPTNWSRRYKANGEKLASGDVNKVAEVVRDLWRRDRDRGLSAGEKRMLAKARQILVSELALAEGTNEDKAEIVLDEVLAEAVA